MISKLSEVELPIFKVINWEFVSTKPFKLPAGVINDRFYLTFTNRISSVTNQARTSSEEDKVSEEVNEAIDVKFENTNQVLQITNSDINTTVNKVQLYNLVGQLVNTWDVRNENQSNIQIPMTSNSTGVYIVKVETTNGSFSKKVSFKWTHPSMGNK